MLNITIQNDGKIKLQSECSKEISKQLNISIQNAKSAVDSAADGRNVLLTQSFDKPFIDKIKNTLEDKGCICEITEN